jgi:hypothetical protein
MTGLPILDLVIGMIFIYFLLSIISSSAVEMVMSGLKIRSQILGEWLLTIFNKEVTQPGGEKVPLGQAIMDHCGITALTKAGKAPSYIGAKTFAHALLEKVTYAANPDHVATNIDEMVASIQQSDALPTDLQRLLLTYAHEAKQTYASLTTKTASEIDIFKNRIEHWYDTNMDRISGNLKLRYARPFTLIVAVVTTLLLNADSVAIAKFLYGNPQVSEALANQAAITATDTNMKKQVAAIGMVDTMTKTQQQYIADIEERMGEIESAQALLTGSIPMGWTKADFTGRWFLRLLGHIPGWAMTVLAIMLGAPFWFDLLNKISNLRGAGNKPTPTTGQETIPKQQ